MIQSLRPRNFNILRAFPISSVLRSMSLHHTSVRRTTAPDKLEVHLTDVETRICELLHDCSKFLREEKGIETSCRIAGGWVRDKLLGSQSNDMDVALSDIMGLAFAEHLTEFAHSKGIELGTITKIEQNPDQSKHLETATFKVFGLDIDLVNLRSEEYAESSRIPTGVSFGTPLEDALRRDITINALFYNVHSREVEDFTGKGLDDLRMGVIRTPMPPIDTFQDDPLRILRCIRFASRYGFEIVPDLKRAVKDPIIQEALVTKVARERVGDEIDKMMKAGDPLRSAQLIHELSLYHSIFSVVPPEVKSWLPDVFLTHDPDCALAASSVLYALIAQENSPLSVPHPSLVSIIRENSSEKARLFLAALLFPYMGKDFTDRKNKTLPVVGAVIRESLKLGIQNHFLDGIPVLFSAVPLITSHIKDHLAQPLDRVRLGLLLRNKLIHNPNTGTHWTTSLLFSLVAELVPVYNVSEDSFDVLAASKITSSYKSFIDTIFSCELQNDVESKPLLNGREVGAVFGVTSTGPWIGQVLEDLVTWQLGNPSASKAECREWLKNQGVDKYIPKDKNEPNFKKPSKRVRVK